ncbi:transposase (plasmid) [Candidatus Megaera polyxenophila]|uniref:transposase n=1 Tax=Candidatus Megaera polyxenophila TaxID=988779 RepID=UPI00249F1DE9|nr:transposase [Candidatus Megaera polyxenophila]
MRSPKKKPFSDSRINSKFKVKNWPKYNDSLRRRGRIDFMISENLCDGWHEDNHSNRKTGRQKTYSDQAIIQVLQIRCLFGLKLRQTQGFLDCIFQMCGLDIKCPDYTTISKRSKKLNIKFEPVRNGEEVNHVAIDSSGIQTYTGNEWLCCTNQIMAVFTLTQKNLLTSAHRDWFTNMKHFVQKLAFNCYFIFHIFNAP